MIIFTDMLLFIYSLYENGAYLSKTHNSSVCILFKLTVTNKSDIYLLMTLCVYIDVNNSHIPLTRLL